MALIKCPECGRDVSDAAAQCPQCGRAIAAPGTPAPAMAAKPGVPAPEQQLWTGCPSLLLAAGKFLRMAIVWAAAIALIWFRGSIAGVLGAWIERWLVIAALAAIGVSVLNVLWAILQLKYMKYSVTTQRVKIERGLFSKSVEDVDLRVIDDTSFTQGVLQRMLGIGHVRVKSHDGDVPDLHMRGIRDPSKVRELIRSQAYAQSQQSLFMRQA